MSENKKIKLFNKPKKQKVVALILIFLWMFLWNVLFEAFHSKLVFGSIHIVSWPFFMSVITFFLQEELSHKERFLHTLLGGGVGLSLAAGTIYVFSLLSKQGLTFLPSICIPLAVVLFVLIVLAPVSPILFNNVGLTYFVIALINSSEAVANLPSYLVSLLLGSIILNLGCILILKLYTKALTKKASGK